jgi:hypothetical protein
MGHSKDALIPQHGEHPIVGIETPPICPRCGIGLEARRAKRGGRSGMRFFGCPNFWNSDNKCTYTINILPDGTWEKPGPRLARVAVAKEEYVGIGGVGVNPEWEDDGLDEDFRVWEKKIEEERVEKLNRPAEITKSSKLVVTLHARYGDKERVTKTLTPRSILLFLDDDDFEIEKIVDDLGREVNVDMVEELFEVKIKFDESNDRDREENTEDRVETGNEK